MAMFLPILIFCIWCFLGHYVHASGPEKVEYDYIVVGAGTCGAPLAARLAEKGRSVLVIETGEDEHLNPLTRWGYFFPSAAYSHLYRNYFTEPEPHVNNRLYHQVTKALGGGSAVNAMVWTRGDPRDWGLIDLEGWTYDEVLPYFTMSENYTGEEALIKAGSVPRGKDGPITLSSFSPNSATVAAVETASHVFGIPIENDNNGGEHESVAIVQRNFKGKTIDTGVRMGTFIAYLRPAVVKLSSQVLEVLTRSTVLKVLLSFDGETPRATGVRFLQDGTCHEVKARHEVILSAGAYITPKLLMLSGIGDCAHLKDVGLECLVSSPQVGKNLIDHINPGSLLFTGPPRNDYDANIVAAYTRTRVVDDLTPDVELGFIMGPPVEIPAVWDKVPSLYVFYSLWLLNDGIGSVRLKNKDPLEDPLLVSGYLRTETDEQRLIKLFRMLIDWADDFATATGLRLEQQASGGNAIKIDKTTSDEEILKQAKSVLSTHWHAAQSCRMGSDDDEGAVVDTKFRFRGIYGLRIIDASSQPVLTNGHPMAVLVMMAERAAEWIIEHARNK